MSVKAELEQLKETLIQQRDELLVKASLAKLEAREEWEKLEEKLGHFVVKMEKVGGAAADASEDAAESIRHLGEELKTAYEKIKRLSE